MSPEYPLLEVAVVIGTETFFGEALPGTGYGGTVIIPLDVASELERSGHRSFLTMADGHRSAADFWVGSLLLEDRTFRVEVYALGDQFIIGREVLDQMEICFQFGKTVRLRFTPEE